MVGTGDEWGKQEEEQPGEKLSGKDTKCTFFLSFLPFTQKPVLKLKEIIAIRQRVLVTSEEWVCLNLGQMSKPKAFQFHFKRTKDTL